jgi:uncharacterized membrane protein (UPF0127 family)
MLRAVAAVLVFALAGCSAPPPSKPTSSSTSGSKVPASRAGVPAPLPFERGVVTVATPTGELRFKVEVAVKDNERQRGLMYRDHLDDDAGMVFIFEREEALRFWMKNTWIPLDMLFINDDLEIVGIVENAEPLTLAGRGVDEPSRFVLELKGGSAAARGIVAGQRIGFEGIAPALWQKGSTP